MNILYIGGGYVGACSAAVSASSGHNVRVFDVDKRKVDLFNSGDRDSIESCLFEKGLGDLLVQNKDRIHFTISYDEVRAFLDTVDAIFLCLPTPEIGDTGESDLSYYMEALRNLSTALAGRNNGAQSQYVAVVNKSTVPIALLKSIENEFEKSSVKNVGVVANPEFLVEGKAVDGALHPDRVVIGARTEKDFVQMRQVYQRFYDAPNGQYIECTPEEATAGKLLANTYLFAKLALCYDMVGRTCESFPGLHFENVRRILTSDERIGNWGFYDSLYAGGSCFIKDSRSLAFQLEEAGESAALIKEIYAANKRQLQKFLERANSEVKDWSQKTVAVLGLAFKRDTNDLRNSPSLPVVEFLQQKGAAQVYLYDPVAMPDFVRHFPASEKIVYAKNEELAVQGADVIIVTTDWPQFRGIADSILENKNQKPLLILDGRRMFQHRYAELQAAGHTIVAVGSPTFGVK